MNSNRLVIPGEKVGEENHGFMSGWGTYSIDGCIVSSVAGIVHTIDKLITVIQKNKPFKPEIGDVILGRIVSIDKKSWRVNINSTRDATLNLVNINLPLGEQRKRSVEDTLLMRTFFQENDLLSGEVLQVHSDGGIAIQTRNLKYGKLKNGLLVKVNHNLVVKMKTHFIELVNNVKCIIGMNGLIWIYYSTLKLDSEYFSDDTNLVKDFEKVEEINKDTSVLLILFRNIVIALDRSSIAVNQRSIILFFQLYVKSVCNFSLEKDFVGKECIKTLSDNLVIDENIEIEIIRLLRKELSEKHKMNPNQYTEHSLVKTLQMEEDNLN